MNFSFRFLPKTDENIKLLKEFGTSFDHEPTWDWPILVVDHDGKILSYVEIINCPILNFAIDPNQATPRLTSELVSQVKAWSQIQHGQCIAGRPKGETNFTDEVMDKLGFTPLNAAVDLFISKE